MAVHNSKHYQFKTNGNYEGYQTTVVIQGKTEKVTISTRRNFQVLYEVNSDNSSTPASSTVTFYNLSKETLSKFEKNDHLKLYTGPEPLFGLLSEGYITNIVPDVKDGQDHTTTITFTEAILAKKNVKVYSKFNGSKTVTKTVKVNGKSINYKKRQVKKVNLAFRKNTKASTIIKRVARDAGYQISLLDLKKDHVFKKGYTVTSKAMEVFASLAKACDTKFYQRRGQIVFESGTKPNPYHENLYFSDKTGLTSIPSHDDADSDGGDSWTFTAFENPQLMAGSVVHVKSPEARLNKLMQVTHVTHTHETGSYTMEVTVDG
ncbi:hypothetical protein [Secundilactobacillus kimchicus]|uniref:hypothetical protein n=1 Tax=Secundilactobacillus kimchicus TaxID=528209 RepID=UPI0024A910CF|nr:hypothetical protein [Secundilactobacillus kimchicus]